MKRLYFLAPHASSARDLVEVLHGARIEDADMHVVAQDDISTEKLPPATLLQTTDVVYASERGLVAGALLGGGFGILVAVAYTPEFVTAVTVTLLGALAGGLFGGWAAGLVGAGIPNSHLRKFEQWLNEGRLLLMVDIPDYREQEISSMILRRLPDVSLKGTESTYSFVP
jgi:hypothetical protein